MWVPTHTYPTHADKYAPKLTHPTKNGRFNSDNNICACTCLWNSLCCFLVLYSSFAGCSFFRCRCPYTQSAWLEIQSLVVVMLTWNSVACFDFDFVLVRASFFYQTTMCGWFSPLSASGFAAADSSIRCSVFVIIKFSAASSIHVLKFLTHIQQEM